MKKSLLAILIGAIILSACIVSGVVANSETPEISTEKKMAKAGETVIVDVTISENPGILGATLKLSYNEHLTLLQAVKGEAFDALTMTSPGKLESPCNFVWDGQDISTSDIKNGTILTLTFKVNENAEVGDVLDINMAYKDGDIVNRDLEAVSPDIVNGSIIVTDGKTKEMTGEIKSATISSGLATVEIESQNDIEKAYLVFAEYDDKGELIQTKIQEVALVKGSHTYTQNIATSGGNVKVYLLDTNNNPLSQSKEVTIETPPEETGVIISAGNVQAHAGDQNITVAVSVKNNPGIMGATLQLTYPEALTLTGCSNGSAFNCLTFTKPGKFVPSCKFVWDAMDLSESDIQDGEILLLTFNVDSSVTAGSYPIELSYSNGDIIDKNMDSLAVNIQNGSISVTK